MSTMYLAFSGTMEIGNKLGDSITVAHAARLMVENEQPGKVLLSLNPAHPLNFVWDQFILEFDAEVIEDKWPVTDEDHIWKMFDQRRRDRVVNGIRFDVYKELYRRVPGGMRQNQLCGSEKGLGHRNIFEYYFFGQETSPARCFGGAVFDHHSLGYRWRPTAPKRSVFVAPIAFSQSNDVFTMIFWKEVIDLLLARDVAVTVNTPHRDQFGSHPRLTYTYQPGDYRALFEQISHQRLVLCGNTGIGWIAGAHGVPLIAGEPPFFWYMDYRYREAGVQSVVDIFDGPDAQRVADMAVSYLENP